MRAAIDKAGRLVIPKALRDSLGPVPGLADEDGFLVIPAADVTVSDDLVRTLRDAGQR